MNLSQSASSRWSIGSVVTGAQVRAARGLLNWTTSDLASEACLTRDTIRRMENCDSVPPVQPAKMTAVIGALEAAGIVFLAADRGVSFGIALRVEPLDTRIREDEPRPPSSATMPEWVDRLSIRQVKAARAMLGWAQSDLASAAGISAPTIKELESKGGALGGKPQTAHAIRQALAAAGVEFYPEEAETGEGVRLKKGCRPNETTRRHRRQRAD